MESGGFGGFKDAASGSADFVHPTVRKNALPDNTVNLFFVGHGEVGKIEPLNRKINKI